MEKIKNLLVSFLVAACAVCLSLAFVACSGGGDKSESKYGYGEEGVYYYSADSETDYLMTLQSGTYMISLKGVSSYSGTYSYDAEAGTVSFKSDGGETFEASFADDAMRLAISGQPYTFLKNVNETVTFMDGNSVVDTRTVTYGKAAETIDGEKSGYIFLGWYEDQSFTTKYTFDTAVTGNLTLYAYYIEIDSTMANFDVNFVMDGDTIYSTKTQNGVVYDIPEVSGILGWWVSDTNDGSELTYKYDGQVLNEATNLYAVKANALGASVYGDKVTWEGSASSVTITVDGTVVTSTAANGAYAYDFDSLSTGGHEIEVSASGYGTENLVYVVNRLARVSNFSVYGTTLVYNAVAGAQYYYISVTCANPAHDHTMVYNGNTLTYDFSNCEMGPDGITFTVYAYGTGYTESISETFVYALILDETKVSIDAATDTAFWTPVENATGYEIYLGGEYVETVTDTEYSFKYEAQGAEIELAVKPVAPGYWSETSTAASYKKVTLAAPEITSVSEYEISWTDVGAVSYELNINGYLIPVEGTTYALSDTDVEHLSDVNMNAVSVTAVGSTVSENSQRSDIYYMTDKTMYSALTYADGVITWIYALAADSYVVSYEGTTETVSGVNSYDITFTHSGENIIDVYFVLDGEQSAMAQISVSTYAVVFDSRGGMSVDTIYVAKGDTMDLVELQDSDYTLGNAEFRGWYTLPDLTADENTSTYGGDGIKIDSGTTFEYDGTLVLYAFWINQQVLVTLDAGEYGEFIDETTGEGLGSVITYYISYNSSTFTLPVPSSADGIHFFTGWFTTRNGGSRYTDAYGKATMRYGDISVVTLYAHSGEAISLSVTTAPNGSGDRVLAVSKGKDLSDYPNDVLTINPKYTVNGTTYPVGVIESSAFNDCQNLVEINIPDTVQYIATVNGGYLSGSGAFSGCTNLEAVNIYETGTKEDQDVGKEITYYSADGVLFSKDSATEELTLIYYPHGKKDKTYTIPSSVGNTTECRYEGGEIVSVEGHPVTTLATRVLAAEGSIAGNRFKMSEIVIPASVSLIENQAFYYSYNIEKITFTEGDTDGSASTLVIENRAFAYCINLTDITLPSRLDDFNTTMFDGCSSLVEINVTAGGKYSSTSGDTETTKGLICSDNGTTIVYCSRYYAGEIVIGSEITAVAEKAFYGCTKITGVVIGKNVTLVEESAFEGCTGIESITFEGGDDSNDLTIKTRAFYGLTNSSFTSLRLPSNLTAMEAYAFGGCTNLVNVYFDAREYSDGSTASLDFASGAFETAGGTSYVINLYLGKNVPTIDISGIFGLSLAYVWIEDGNANYSSDEDGVVYDAEMKTLIFYPSGKVGGYTIPDGVQTVSDNVFNGKTNLTYIYIPASVSYIGYQAFFGCTSLAEIEFALVGGTELGICDRAFYGCSALKEITLPYWLNYMGGYTGTELTSLEVFDGCASLEKIVIDDVNGTCQNFQTADGALYLAENGVATTLLLCPRLNTGSNGVLEIPGTVTAIGDRAFYETEGITKVCYEGGVAENGVTFGTLIAYKSAIEEIELPVGTEAIPAEFCYYATELVTVTIPYTVETIDYRAFYHCEKLTTIVWGENSSSDADVELRFTDTSGSERASTFEYCTSLSAVSLPERTTLLGTYMFYSCIGITSVYIGAKIEAIPQYCFYGCTSLTEVEFGGEDDSKLEKIEPYAFTSTSLVSMTMPTNLKEIGDNAFSGHGVDGKPSTVEYVKFNKNLEKIGDDAFWDCTALKEIVFEEPDVTDYTLSLEIGEEAFYRAAVTQIDIPYYVTTIGGFASCDSLTTVNFANTPDDYIYGTDDGHEGHMVVIGGYAFSNCSALTHIEIPWYVSSVGDYAFQYDRQLTSVSFGNSADESILTDISDYAFQICTSLKEISLPASLETIGKKAFSECSALATATFETNATTGYASLTEIGDNAFMKSGLTSFAFPKIDIDSNPDGISLGDSIFKQCTKLEKVTLSNGVLELGSALSFCYSIKEVEVGEGCGYKAASGGSPILYSVDGTEIAVVYGEIKGDLYIEDGVLELPDSILIYQNTMTSVSIPASVTSIGQYAFQGCTDLKTVTFRTKEDGSEADSLTSIGRGAFTSCTSLVDINLPDSVESFARYAFYGCTSLKEIEIPSQVSLNAPSYTNSNRNLSYDFQNCTSLEKVVFRGVPEEIGRFAFAGCTSLKTIGMNGTYTDGVVDLSAMSGTVYFGQDAFEESGVEKVILPAADFGTGYSGTSEYYTFKNCKSLKEVTFSETGSSTLCNSMFSGCSALEKVVLNSQITIYSPSNDTTPVFRDCTSLKTVITGGCVIPAYTFYGCTSLDTISEYEENAVDGVADISSGFDQTEKTSSSGRGSTTTTTTGGYHFYGCTSLSFVVLPDSCTVSQYMFYGCTSLKTVTTSSKYATNGYVEGVADLGGVSKINTYAFAGSGVETLILPAFTGTAAMFMDCVNLTSVTFASGSTTLGTASFAGCTSLESITLPSNVTLTAGTSTSGDTRGVFADSGLKTVYMDGATKFANYAFYGCTNLSTVANVTEANYTTDAAENRVIDENTVTFGVVDLTCLTTTYMYLFYGCTSIECVVYPSTLVSTGSYEFAGCTSLSTFAILTADDDGEYDFSEIKYGVVDLTNLTTIGTYLFQDCTGIEKVILPVAMTSISEGAFYGCVNLTTVGGENTEDGVADLVNITQIGSNAFRNTGIKELILGKQTSSSYTAQFYGCENLEKVTLKDDVTIGKGMFADCTALKEVVAEGYIGVTIVAGTDTSSESTMGAFSGCVGLTTFDVALDSVPDYTFYGCSSLAEINLLSYTSVGKYAFAGCSSITSVEMPFATSLGANAFQDCTALEEVYFISMTSLPAYAFCGCSSLSDVSIPLVTSLSSNAFYGCVALTSVNISLLSSIPDYAFYGCANLADIDLSAVETIGNYSFYGCLALQSVDLSSATSVGDFAFYRSGLTSLTIPAALDTVGICAFSGCVSLADISVGDGNNVYAVVEDAYLVDYVNATLVFCLAGLGDVVVPDGVTSIGEYAFYGYEADSLRMSEGVESIGGYAFMYAEIDDVELPVGLKTIESYAFYLTGIESVEIPASVTCIGSYAFAGAYSTSGSTTNITIQVTEYSGIKSVTFAESEGEEVSLEISTGAFAASSLESIDIPDRVTSFGQYAFCATSYMRTITFGSGVTQFPQYLCIGSGVEEVEIPETVTDIYNYDFYRCESLEKITLHDGLDQIYGHAFMYSGLKEVSIPGTISKIGTHAFAQSESLEKVVYEEGVTSTSGSTTIGDVFNGCSSLTEIVFPETLEAITPSNFVGTALSEIVVPRNVSTIADEAFKDIDGLNYIYLSYETAYESIRMTGNAVKTGDTNNDYGAWRDNCGDAVICYYSESEPEEDDFTYWHYDADGVTPVVWGSR